MAKVAIQPLGKRVVVVPVEETEEKTAGGLYVPPSAQEESRPNKGKIVKVGDKVEQKQLKEGVVVYFKKYSTESVEIDGEEYMIIEAKDVLALEA